MYLYSFQIKGESNKKTKKSTTDTNQNKTLNLGSMQTLAASLKYGAGLTHKVLRSGASN
jgi:hypothetical protein